MSMGHKVVYVLRFYAAFLLSIIDLEDTQVPGFLRKCIWI